MALPPDIELDRFLLATETYIEKQDYSTAMNYLNQAEELSVELPAVFYYYKGLILQQRKQNETARTAFETYVEATGKDGEHYQNALMQITLLENKITKSPTTNSATPEIDWSSSKKKLEGTSGKDYEDSIKSLYLTDSYIPAFVAHINSLLVTYPYTGKRIISENQDKSIHYSISVDDEKHISIHKHHKSKGGTQITAFKQAIFGISPDFSRNCDERALKCELTHLDDLTIWFETSYDQDAINEVEKATSHLIKILQRPSTN